MNVAEHLIPLGLPVIASIILAIFGRPDTDARRGVS
jgi:hypothetical protein